jgi:hypothetical protein
MKRTWLRIFMILAAVLPIGLTGSSCHNPVIPSYPVNNDLINYESFSLSAEEVGLKTATGGTIFVRGDKEKSEDRRIEISAWVEIDAADWGGVSFNIPRGWEVTHVASDYPQGNSKPETYATVLQTESPKEKYNRIVEIGNTRHGAAAPQGGKGNLIIELAPKSSKQALPENIEVLIGVGSKDDYILNPVGETIEVPLNTDYRLSTKEKL